MIVIDKSDPNWDESCETISCEAVTSDSNATTCGAESQVFDRVCHAHFCEMHRHQRHNPWDGDPILSDDLLVSVEENGWKNTRRAWGVELIELLRDCCRDNRFVDFRVHWDDSKDSSFYKGLVNSLSPEFIGLLLWQHVYIDDDVSGYELEPVWFARSEIKSICASAETLDSRNARFGIKTKPEDVKKGNRSE